MQYDQPQQQIGGQATMAADIGYEASPTQKDYLHNTQSSPSVPGGTLPVINEEHEHEKSSTRNMVANDVKSSPPVVQQSAYKGDDDDEDDSVPRYEYVVESQVEMNRERERTNLLQHSGIQNKHRVNFKPPGDTQDDVIPNSDGNTQKYDDSQPTQVVNAIPSSDQGTQPTQLTEPTQPVHVPQDVTEATQQLNISQEEEEEPSTQVFGTNSDDEQPTQAVHHSEQSQPPANTQLVNDPIVQVSSTPISQTTARKRRTIYSNANEETPSSLEKIISSDNEDNDLPDTQPVHSNSQQQRQQKPQGPMPNVAATVMARKRKLVELVTPDRPLQFGVVGNSSPGTVLWQGGSNENVAKRSRLAEETPITMARHSSVIEEDSKVQPSGESADIGDISDGKARSECSWVHWTGDKYYPVKRISRSVVSKKLFSSNGHNRDVVEILFGDGREGEAALSHLHPLDLSIGDVVKYEDDKKVNWQVAELKNSEDFGTILTACGNNCAILITKSGSRQVEAPIWKLYMVHKLWTNYLAKREKLKNAFALSETQSLLGSPRRKAVVKYEEEPSSPTGARSSSVNASNNIAVSGTGIFQGCLFAVTMESNPTPRYDEKLIRLIEGQGGMVLREGFKELFNIKDSGVYLKEEHNEVKFVAVIANTFRRTNKYMEALALGWPCLSYKYVEDCIDAGKVLQNWSCYVLAAGLSDLLDAVVSADITHFWTCWNNNASLKDIFSSRKEIFGNVRSTIYLVEPVMGNKAASSKDNSSKETFRFLLRVCGCCQNLKIVDSMAKVPAGSVVIENYQQAKTSSIAGNSTGATAHKTHSPGILDSIIAGRKMPANKTVIYSRQWVVQSIINRRIV